MKNLHLVFVVFLATFIFLLRVQPVTAQSYGCAVSVRPGGNLADCVPFGSCPDGYQIPTTNQCAVDCPTDTPGSGCMNVDGCGAQSYACVPITPPQTDSRCKLETTGVCTSCTIDQVGCTFTTCQDCQDYVAANPGVIARYSCDPGGTGQCSPDPNGNYLSDSECKLNCPAGVVNPPNASFEGFCAGGQSIDTAIGCIPITLLTTLTKFFLTWLLGIGGGIAFLTFIVAGIQILTSSGDPAKLANAKSLFMSSISGIILLVFSIFLLRVIGVNVLGLF